MSCRIPSNLESNIEIKDTPYQDKIILFDSLKQEFQKYYEFKEVTLNLGIHTFFLIFVIPKRIPKIYQKDYKALDSQRKDYGIGYFKELLEYNKDYKETNTQNNPYTPFLLYHTRVFLAPAKAKKIHFEFALGLDNYIESKDKESNTNVCKFKVLSGDVIEEREEVEGGDDIPDNVIRIETEDGSGEYIEIEFDENDNLKDINNDDELNDLLHQAKDILYELSPLSSMESAYDNLTAGEYKDALIDTITILPMAKVFKAKTIANKIGNIISKDKRKTDVRIQADKNTNANVNTNKNSNTNAGKKIKSKYATKQEVINVIENKYGLKTSNQLNKAGYKEFKNSKNVYWARDSKQIREIWDDITEGAEELQDIEKDKLGGSIKRRKLSDGTVIKLRQKSKSGGSAIEIEKESTDQIKIHSIKDKK